MLELKNILSLSSLCMGDISSKLMMLYLPGHLSGQLLVEWNTYMFIAGIFCRNSNVK